MNDRRSLIPKCKQSLREEVLARRSSLLASERAAQASAITTHLLALPEWQQADTIFAYVSLPAEVSTVALIEAAWEQGKTLAFPRVDQTTKRLLWYSCKPQPSYAQLAATDQLADAGFERSAFGVWEPLENPAALLKVGEGYPEIAGARPAQGVAAYAPVKNPQQLAVIPGLVYDHVGYRLGYGMGCYDRFLSIFPGFSVGVVHSSNLIYSLESEQCLTNRDLPVRCVICDTQVIRP